MIDASIFNLSETRARLIARRMIEPNPIKRERLTIIIENLSGLLAAPDDPVLRRQLAMNVRDMEAA